MEHWACPRLWRVGRGSVCVSVCVCFWSPRWLMPISQSPATPLMDEQVHGDQSRRWTLNNKRITQFSTPSEGYTCIAHLDVLFGSNLVAFQTLLL